MKKIKLQDIYLGIKVVSLNKIKKEITFIIIVKQGFLHSLSGKKITIYKEVYSNNYLYLDENNFDLKSNSEYKYLYSLPVIFEKYLFKIEKSSDFSSEEKTYFINIANKMKNITNLNEIDLEINFDNLFEIYCFSFGNPVIKEENNINYSYYNTSFEYSKKFKVIDGKKNTKKE